MKVLTKESIEEFKKLKSWVQECPIEAAMEIEDLRIENKRLRNAVQRMETASNLVLETIRDEVLDK
ncbi:hypothetical protein FQ087_20815 [Sporosarcina sp. ANT_H38]|uniref:hypothetical protein n=1 Tax=Sporosarcina sp. ANT_H38 TaxID=2597358 RepID=UPI0011F0F8C9|nr:hypothetical protein [Sporosarcina sp. ANT_H38]KAA0941602.1 hypothetical protein FQ087_20815 [Sporosarcina sp. ANT_H38]